MDPPFCNQPGSLLPGADQECRGYAAYEAMRGPIDQLIKTKDGTEPEFYDTL